METETKTTETINTKEVKPNVFDVLELQYTSIEEQIEALSQKREQLRKTIIDTFEKLYGNETTSYKSQITGNTLQRVISTYVNYDEDKLKDVLSRNVWNSITTRKVSRELFMSALKNGKIDVTKITPAVVTKIVDKLYVRK
ncbi:MAG: hypothetical protein GX031_10315 [Candidatus Riflebacteria bacterium]|nr:hypothetical protein [Candidatus Riflebacteria bacterium]